MQEHLNEMVRLHGSITGQPPFSELEIRAGSDFGLRSEGQTVITELPGGDTYNVESFFDIQYEIDFVGTPGSELDGFSGSTYGQVLMETGTPPQSTGACCHPDGSCAVTENADCDFEWLAGEICAPNPCPQPEGACCAPDGSCTITTEADCSDDWMGMDVPCDPNPCPVLPEPCIRPNNGSGTVDLPPDGCFYLSPAAVHAIIEGLPPGTTIELAPIHDQFFTSDRYPGGGLDGEVEIFDSNLRFTARGTEDLEGYTRVLDIPIGCEVHTGPRDPGASVQVFPNDMFRLEGSLLGDPDFAELVITGGTDFGMPSPGQTTLTVLPGGDYNVDSFFDITYRIDFEGAPGSPLDGFAGSTVGTLEMKTGEPVEPPTGACCELDDSCTETVEGDCDTGDWRIYEDCDPNPCPDELNGVCCAPDGSCAVTVQGNCGHDWLGAGTSCTPNPCPPPIGPCYAPDNGSGTIDLPPADCFYLSPDAVHLIIEGLPPDTEIHLSPAHDRFMNTDRTPGGVLGGEVEIFESRLQIDMWGTGDLEGFQRSLEVPIGCEVHTGPRTPGEPVQDFLTQMQRLEGDIVGDPDFQELHITAGNDLGLPSPGRTILTRLRDNDFNVDSNFFITYQIEFVGAPGSPLDGMSGTTSASLHMQAGEPAEPPVGACCAPDNSCTMTTEVECEHDWIGPQYDCEPENPCPNISTEKTSWGSIKARYR